jgi:hypothetical protein
MARVIEFYIPHTFKGNAKIRAVEQSGKIIAFPQRPGRKSA